MVHICEVCETNASQPDTFICEDCMLRIAIPMEGEDSPILLAHMEYGIGDT